jgi:hypothetical protein
MPDAVADPSTTPAANPANAIDNGPDARGAGEDAARERLPWYGWLGVGVVGGLLIGKVLR